MTMTTETKAKMSAPPFPADEIEVCIRDFLAKEVAMQAELLGTEGTSGIDNGRIGPEPLIDSLMVVEMLIELELKMPSPLPDSLVRPGGYDSIDEAINDLLLKLESRWRRHYEEGK